MVLATKKRARDEDDRGSTLVQKVSNALLREAVAQLVTESDDFQLAVQTKLAALKAVRDPACYVKEVYREIRKLYSEPCDRGAVLAAVWDQISECATLEPKKAISGLVDIGSGMHEGHLEDSDIGIEVSEAGFLEGIAESIGEAWDKLSDDEKVKFDLTPLDKASKVLSSFGEDDFVDLTKRLKKEAAEVVIE